jgi:hypothetical protein
MKRNPSFLAIVLAALVVAALPAHAQLGIYGGFAAGQLTVPVANVNSSEWAYGGNFGAYLARGHFGFFRAGLDARAEILKGSAGSSVAGSASYSEDAGYIGPRVGFRPHIVPIQPYVEGLVGAAHISDTATTVHSIPVGTTGFINPQESQTKFSYQIVAGLDYTIFPRIDWRVAEIGYGTLRAFGANVNPTTVSTGIVIRLPRVF